MQQKITFAKKYETKGAVRYSEVVNGKMVDGPHSPGCLIGTLYVRRSSFPGIAPEKLRVTLQIEA